MSKRRQAGRTFQDDLVQFRRTIHASSSFRAGIGVARNAVQADHLPGIVAELARTQLYLPQLAVRPFPRTLSDFGNRQRLVESSTEKEFLWCAAVMRIFAPELAEFVQLRLRFEGEYLSGHLNYAEELLTTIEAKYGVSIWLIANRLQLLQLQRGLKAQKDYLEKLISVNGFNKFAAWIAYYCSMRSEENTSLASFETELLGLRGDSRVADYLTYHINPYDVTRLSDTNLVINWDEPMPVIDRFQSLVAMVQLYISRSEMTQKNQLVQAVSLLRSVGEPRIDKILALFKKGGPNHTGPGGTTTLFDSYTEGNYRGLEGSRSDLCELAARANAMDGRKVIADASSSLSVQIISAMTDVILVSDDYQKAILKLKKLALTCVHQPIANLIAAFIERKHDHLFVKEYSELDRLAALDGPLDNPWNASVFAEISGDKQYLEGLLANYPHSPALRLFKSLSMDLNEGMSEIMALSLPAHRSAMYRGHLFFQHKMFAEAAGSYRMALKYENEFITARAKSYLYRALFAQGLVRECLDLVVDHCLTNLGASSLYPIEELVNACLGRAELHKNLSLAILLHMAALQLGPSWERELSDVYESVQVSTGTLKPTDIPIGDPAQLPRMVYFLRYVCVPRILEDTTTFESVSEIEAERIAVCQKLIEIDAAAADAYSSEIRAITRGANVSQMLEQVEASKIYVDEAGIRSAVQESITDAFIRYQQLLRTPELGYQAEKISKLVGELVGDLLGDKTPSELKKLKLPASEQEGLFASMANELVVQFAANPAYGLDTHLSTTIRHGAFEGHTRSPLAVEGLLAPHTTDAEEYALPERWQGQLSHLSSDELNLVRRQLGRFTERVENHINLWHKQLLKIRGLDGNTQGLFDLNSRQEELLELSATLTEKTSYVELVDKLMSYAWHLTDRSMENIRSELRNTFLSQINAAFDSLIASIEGNIASGRVAALTDAVVRARTNFQGAVDSICSWFQRPTNLRRDPFDFDLAVDVALLQIQNCYVNSPITPLRQITIADKIDGEFFDSFVEVLFILFQNAIRHSGYEGPPPRVAISVTEIDSAIEIEIFNSLAPHIDIESRRRSAAEAMQRYERDTAMKMARLEGGSGLSKVWRILEFDVRKPHTLNLLVDDQRKFLVALRISDIPRVR